MSIHLTTQKIIKEWTDYNNHMNLSYYILVFDMSAEVFLSKFKMGEHSAKTTTRKKVQQELFQSDRVTQFMIVAGLKYPKYENFKNDYSKWKRLPMFRPSWKKGTITIDKALAKKAKRLAAKKNIFSKFFWKIY